MDGGSEDVKKEVMNQYRWRRKGLIIIDDLHDHYRRR